VQDRGGRLRRGAPGKGAPSTPSAKVLARGRARQSTYGQAAAAASTRGLTLLQDQKVKDATRSYFDVAVAEFATWIGIARPETLPGAALDGHVTRYLDHLFLEEYNHERGDKLLAALLHLAPVLGRAAAGSFPCARAAMKGFRRLAHGLSRSPLPMEAAYALIGHSLALGRREFALALLIGWDAMLRMPVDIMGITPRWLVPPVPAAGAHRWGLLLYPEDETRRSKVAGPTRVLSWPSRSGARARTSWRGSERGRRASASGASRRRASARGLRRLSERQASRPPRAPTRSVTGPPRPASCSER
jgi:hypothetical protein